MSNTVKNSIFLGFILVLICLGGWFWIKGKMIPDLDRLTQTKDTRQQEYDEMRIYADAYYQVVESFENLKQEMADRDKVIMVEEDSKISFDYINVLASYPDSYLNFLFAYGNQEESERYTVSNYMFQGDAYFSNLLRFLWKLENYKRLYIVKSLSLNEISRVEERDQLPRSLVQFTLSFSGYSSKVKIGPEEIVDDAEMPNVRFK